MLAAGPTTAAARPSRCQQSAHISGRRGRTMAVHSTAAANGAMQHSAPLFRFGLLADVQHADMPDGKSFHGTPRYYRYALQQLDAAVDAMKAQNVDFAIHLGDIIDYHNSQLGICPESDLHHSEKALRRVLERFSRLGRPTLHLLGNHCLYNHSREVLNERLGIRALQAGFVPHSHYTYRPAAGWKLIMLDGYDVSVLGWPAGHPLHEQAKHILDTHNPNENKNSNDGLVGTQRRFVKFGGGVGEEQLAWLRRELGASRVAGERVIVACHLCFHPATCPPTCLLYNYEQVQQVLQEHAGTVVGTLAGHAHSDGYHRDGSGIHHRVCKAILETPPGKQCYGIVEVSSDQVRIHGVDTFASQTWELPPCPQQQQQQQRM